MKIKKLLFIFFFIACIILFSSCNNPKEDKINYEIKLNNSKEINIKTLLVDLTILHQDDLEDGEIILSYNALGKHEIDENNSHYSISNIDSFEGYIKANKNTEIKSLDISAETINFKTSVVKINSLSINSKKLSANISYSNILKTNINTYFIEYSYMFKNNLNIFDITYTNSTNYFVYENYFNEVTVKGEKNNFSFTNNTFTKASIIKESGYLDINLPAEKGFYAEIDCPNVLFDFETISFNNKYYYLTSEYELYIENPNGAVSITRYFSE